MVAGFQWPALWWWGFGGGFWRLAVGGRFSAADFWWGVFRDRPTVAGFLATGLVAADGRLAADFRWWAAFDGDI